MTKISILLFAAIVLLGPIYTVKDYSVISNLISELGAQETQNNYIMIIGFLILGLGIIVDSIKHMSYSVTPFMLFGIFMIAVGISPHRPIDPIIEYSTLVHELHGIFATLAGVSITTGFIWQGIKSKQAKSKGTCFYLAIVCFVFPMLMLAWNDYQGIIQRLMYLQVFIWMWMMFPDNILSNKRIQPGAGQR
jgi:hypothetical membrane protein